MKKIYIALAAALACLSIPAGAQSALKSGYFVENYTYRHQLNPAFASQRSYFAIPLIGNTTVTANGNVGISNFFYPRNGQLTTFMNSSVSATEFLGGLQQKNRLGADIYLPIVSVGTWGRNGGFTTVEASIKTSASVNLPYSLFDFMKNVGTRSSFDIDNIGMRAKSYMEIALGHSHKITDRLNVGAKVKFILGMMSANANIDNIHLQLTQDRWSANASGSMKISVPVIEIPTKGQTGTAENASQNNELDFNNITTSMENAESAGDVMKSLFSGLGYGAAIDLGATYTFDDGLLEGLNLSASVLDLGFISWGKALNAVSSSSTWEFDGFDEISMESGNENSLKEQFNSLADSFGDLLRFNKEGSDKMTEMLNCTVNIGAEYEMPFYRNLSVGFLSSTRISGKHSASEGRFSVNVEPVNWFGFSTSYGISTFGSSWGAIANFNLPGIGLFIGTDCIPLNLTKGLGINLPYKKANFNLSFGLSFNLSKVKHLGDRM